MALRAARARAEAAGWSDWALASQLHEDVRIAEVNLAQATGEPWAEVLDLGVEWDGGAPLPHLVSGSGKTIVVCRSQARDPEWNGTTVRVVSASDAGIEPLLVLKFEGCTSVRFGFPNVDVLHGLGIAGTKAYQAHPVINSPWLPS
jgi:hypothetical protein